MCDMARLFGAASAQLPLTAPLALVVGRMEAPDASVVTAPDGGVSSPGALGAVVGAALDLQLLGGCVASSSLAAGGAAGGGEAPEASPAQLNTTHYGQDLQVMRDKLGARYVGRGQHSNDVGAIQADAPVPRRCAVYYFEMRVVAAGEHGTVAIGFADAGVKLTRQPGWEQKSFGYHGDDGRKFHSSGRGDVYGPRYGEGDVVGAGIEMATREIFFTRNGVDLGVAWDLRNTAHANCRLLPTIGMHSYGEEVRLNFGQEPFTYDLAGRDRRARLALAARIREQPVSAEATREMVRRFLAHHGYEKTLKALDASETNGAAEARATLRAVEADTEATADRGAGAGANGDADGNCENGGSEQRQKEALLPLPDAFTAHEPRRKPGPGARRPDAALGGAFNTTGKSNAEGVGEDAMRTLSERAAIREALMAGDVEGARHRLASAFPQALADGSRAAFHLACQAFLELVRAGRLEEAISHSQAHLSKAADPSVLGKLGAPGEAELATRMLHLMDVMSVLAYDDVQSSPAARLLSHEQRERTADEVNEAVLLDGWRPTLGEPRPVDPLLRLCQHLVVCRREEWVADGCFGEMLDLEKELRGEGVTGMRDEESAASGAAPMEH